MRVIFEVSRLLVLEMVVHIDVDNETGERHAMKRVFGRDGALTRLPAGVQAGLNEFCISSTRALQRALSFDGR